MHTLAVEILAGYLGGCAKTLAFYPLDTLTTWRECPRHAPRPNGLASLYAGCGLTLFGAAPYAALFHTAFWASECAVPSAAPPAVAQLVAGTCGAVAAVAVGVPAECLKHRMQLGGLAYATPRRALRSTLGAEGMRGLYSGMGSTLARNVPYNALHFGLFALAAGLLRRARLPAGTIGALAGALAGALTALLTAPLDLANTRLQTQTSHAGFDGGPQYTGVMDALSGIAADEGGPAALMQGARTRVTQYALAGLLFFSVYDGIKRRLLLATGLI